MVLSKGSRLFALLLCSAFAIAHAPAGFAEKLKPQSEIPIEKQRLLPATKKVEITGEVVDAWCYASQVMGPGRGEKHKACALACIHGGVSPGILDEKTGELFVAAKHKGFLVKGWIARKGGCNLIKIQEVKLAPEKKPGEKKK
ncbi:MAG TPA: hypothetical protein EYN91_26480 [Candidatus Melainabacteria bacterium]|nr:hypothetical protein [Candidatus Melainabacteria bacterium]